MNKVELMYELTRVKNGLNNITPVNGEQSELVRTINNAVDSVIIDLLDEEKNELLKVAKEVIAWHVNTPDYFDKTEGFGKDLDKLKNVIRKIEGDTQ